MSLNKLSLTNVLEPPFSDQQSIFSPPASLVLTHGAPKASKPAQLVQGSSQPLDLILPAVYQDAKRKLQKLDHSSPAGLAAYFAWNLNVDRLMKIYKHLWIAGLPQGPRALHAQILVDRQIYITERADLHLLWQGPRVFLKPLPDYLMCHDVWQQVLCKKRHLYEEASGYLLSYIGLICDQSDLRIAHDCGLISEKVDWVTWSTFSQAVASNLKLQTFEDICPRYVYGELRLTRVDNIYRFCSRTTSLTTFLRGYQYAYHDYTTFIERNFAWFLTFIIYVGLVLTAMQVGLGTVELRDNLTFNRASYGLTVFAILAPLIVIVVAGLTVLVLVLFNGRYALERRKKASEEYPTLFDSKTLQRHAH